jgi:hypothetical protein
MFINSNATIEASFMKSSSDHKAHSKVLVFFKHGTLDLKRWSS